MPTYPELDNLKSLYRYDSETGFFYSLSPYRKKFTEPLRKKDKDGYILICIRDVYFKAHRLAWYYHYGEVPTLIIDHLNGVRDDNRIDNLRLVSHRENCHNSYKIRRGKLVGCSYHKRDKVWISTFTANGKSKYLGCFKTEKEAHEAYLKALNHFKLFSSSDEI